MYWDDETSPSVECPFGDFFGVGHGMNVPLESIPVVVAGNGLARNCYWPMPFRKRARITITNEGKEFLPILYFIVDWDKVEALDEDVGYFHAQYRQAFPKPLGSRYVVADIEGRGHYVGTVFNVRQRVGRWFGEGDDFFFIDGETTPSLRGTGTEDYFGSAWGFEVFNGPYFGSPVYEGEPVGARITAYRWHIPDPIHFSNSLRFELEHMGNVLTPSGEWLSRYADRPDDLSSVAFWYQVEPHKPWDPIPRGYDRLPPEPIPDSPFEAGVSQKYAEYWLRRSLELAGAGITAVHLPSIDFRGTRARIRIPNPTRVPMEARIVFEPHGQLGAKALDSQVEVPAGEAREIEVNFRADRGVDVRSLNPAVAELICVFRPEGESPVVVTLPHRVLFEAPYPCPESDSQIRIDGRLDEWPALPFVCEVPGELRQKASAWTGPSDCSFRFGVVREGEDVCVAVKVTDDIHSPVYTRDANLQDTVTILLDPGEGREACLLTVNAAMTPEDLRYFPNHCPPDLQFAWGETETGYALEARFPGRWLSEGIAGTWKRFRLNVFVYDLDDPEMTEVYWRPAWEFEQDVADSGVFFRD
jgi:hypothetical protein